MKIVVLDGYTLNPGDLDWAPLKELGDVTIYDRTELSQVIERAKDAEAILTNKVVITREEIEQLPKLKYIGVLATGYNIVDLKAAHEEEIVVTNIPAYATMSVAQMVFAHILNISNQVALHSQLVKQGEWSKSKDFCFWRTPQHELAGYTLGIIGLGNTGMATAKIGLAFGMKIKAFTSRKRDLPEGVEAVSLDELYTTSDYLSLHCPLNPTTHNLINRFSIDKMKNSVVIINTGRGGLINEEDLAQALNEGRIAAAGLDVLVTEPPKSDNPLIKAKNCYITPHIAWATFEARGRLLNMAVENLKLYMNNTIINQVTM